MISSAHSCKSHPRPTLPLVGVPVACIASHRLKVRGLRYRSGHRRCGVVPDVTTCCAYVGGDVMYQRYQCHCHDADVILFMAGRAQHAAAARNQVRYCRACASVSTPGCAPKCATKSFQTPPRLRFCGAFHAAPSAERRVPDADYERSPEMIPCSHPRASRNASLSCSSRVVAETLSARG